MTDHLIDEQIRTLATAQHGLVARRQLRKLGMAPAAIIRRARNGSLKVESTRVLRLAGSPDTDASVAMAAVLDVGPNAVVSHTSAAALWGLPGFALRPVDVTGVRVRVCNRGHDLAVIHQPRRLLVAHHTELDHIPVTTPSRLIFDIASTPRIHPKRVERLLDTCWARGLVCHASLHRVFGDIAGRGRAGTILMRELLAARPADYQPPGSSAESRFQEICRGVGLRAFERQVNLGDDARWIGRVDFIDRNQCLVVEIDSALYHGSVTDRRADGARHEALRKAGFRVESFDGDDLFHRRPQVEQRLRLLVRQAV